MDSLYRNVFTRIANVYGRNGVNCVSLLDMVDSGAFKDGLEERRYRIVQKVTHEFFETRNAINRRFGLDEEIAKDLAKKCEEEEIRQSNTLPQSA